MAYHRIPFLRFRWAYPHLPAYVEFRSLRGTLHLTDRKLYSLTFDHHLASWKHASTWKASYGPWFERIRESRRCHRDGKLTRATELTYQQLFRPAYAPDYRLPFYVSLGLNVFAIVGYTAYRYGLLYVNKRRARIISTWTAEEIEQENLGDARLGDKKHTFVFCT